MTKFGKLLGIIGIVGWTSVMAAMYTRPPPSVVEVYTLQEPQIAIRTLHPIKPTFENLPKDIKQEIRCLAHNIYFEARSEPHEGRLAVAHVTLNRVESSHFPSTICEVVREQRRRNICQFSWWCVERLRTASLNNRLAEREVYLEIRELATKIVTSVDRIDITDGALFYHANYVEKSKLGSMSLVATATYGQHIFYRIE